MQWTDRIRQVRLVLITVAVLLSVASLVVSHYLVRDLKHEEQTKMETWAEAMRSLEEADEHTDISLVLRVLNSNNTIPVKVVDSNGNVQMQRNMEDADRIPQHSIRISLTEREWLDVYYDDSLMLRRLVVWPYVQLGIVSVFVIVALFALLSSKKAEQNKVWVGLSKETAHQLGTPISSLMAWVEVLKDAYPDDTLIPEMERDVQRLRLIAERFSKIGSLPELHRIDVAEVISRAADYVRCRVSNRVSVRTDLPGVAVEMPLCAPLFEWVVENLCKNAVDAMGGEGSIVITLRREAYMCSIEVADTGKGIPQGKWKTVFLPGYTTKSRGWGLGLSLAKRIIEEYHRGRIYVKSSEPGHGTVFRIEMKL